jgi:hypothetical protein
MAILRLLFCATRYFCTSQLRQYYIPDTLARNAELPSSQWVASVCRARDKPRAPAACKVCWTAARARVGVAYLSVGTCLPDGCSLRVTLRGANARARSPPCERGENFMSTRLRDCPCWFLRVTSLSRKPSLESCVWKYVYGRSQRMSSCFLCVIVKWRSQSTGLGIDFFQVLLVGGPEVLVFLSEIRNDL